MGPRAGPDGRKISSPLGFDGWVGVVSVVSVLQAEACNTDTTPTQPYRNSNTHRNKNTSHNQCGDTIEKSQAPDDGCINVRNMLSIEEVK